MSAFAIHDIRPSPIAGTWYPGRRSELADSIDRLLEAASVPAIEGLIKALVVPHAGHRYSGQIAARAFRLVQGMEFARVVVISPMHHPYPGNVLTSSHDAYETPLGVIPVDGRTVQALQQHIPLKAVRRDPEHSLEIELPFLQRALRSPFTLVPLMLRDQSYDTAARVGEALALVLPPHETTLLVASSDLSHFYTVEEAEVLDHTMLARVAAFDPEGVIRIEDEGKGFACGRAAIAAVMVAARRLGGTHAEIVGYGTSADATGDTRRVVGYGAAVLVQRAKAESAATEIAGTDHA